MGRRLPASSAPTSDSGSTGASSSSGRPRTRYGRSPALRAKTTTSSSLRSPTSEPPMTAARQFPRVRFLITDAPNPPGRRLKNVERSVYRAEEAGYLAGYLAALMESRDQRQACDQRCRRRSVRRRRPLDRRLPGGRDPSRPARSPSGSTIRRTSATRPSASESPAARSPRDRARLQRLGSLRHRSLERREGGGCLGRRGRHRPVVSRATHPHQRRHAARQGRLRRSSGGSWHGKLGGDGTACSISERRSRAGQISKKVRARFLRRVETIRDQIVAGKIRVPRA